MTRSSSPPKPGRPEPFGPDKLLLSAVSAETFEQDVLQAGGLVLVDFWASYCSVCRAMEPVLEALAAEVEGAVRIVTLDVETYPGVADRYGVRTLPTLLLFKGGEPIGQATGFVSQHVLAKNLQAVADAAVVEAVAGEAIAS